MSIKRLTPRTADVGGIPIARLLPNKVKQPIGAWCFLDHAGPVQFGEHEPGMQVGRHPHTNLQTFTWMLEGEVLHQDSLGNKQVIRKHQVNLMTAGTGPEQGISHTEQSVFSETGGSADATHSLHAVQLWIALPMNQAIERSFYHYPNVPSWHDHGVTFTLTTGRYTDHQGTTHTAPTLQYSPLIGMDVHFLADASAKLALQPSFEYGILVIAGTLHVDGVTFAQDELAYIDANDCDHIVITAQAGTRLMFIGAEPLAHPILLWWNFVDNTKAGIEQSITDWNNHHPRFGDVDVAMKRLPAPPLPDGFRGA